MASPKLSAGVALTDPFRRPVTLTTVHSLVVSRSGMAALDGWCHLTASAAAASQNPRHRMPDALTAASEQRQEGKSRRPHIARDGAVDQPTSPTCSAHDSMPPALNLKPGWAVVMCARARVLPVPASTGLDRYCGGAGAPDANTPAAQGGMPGPPSQDPAASVLLAPHALMCTFPNVYASISGVFFSSTLRVHSQQPELHDQARHVTCNRTLQPPIMASTFQHCFMHAQRSCQAHLPQALRVCGRSTGHNEQPGA
jgi:hypothetical protein